MQEQISVRELWEKLESGEAVRIVDVRERDEFAEVHAVGAVNFPLSELASGLEGFGSDEAIALICRAGIRSESARRYLASQFSNLSNVTDGMLGWVAAGLPVE